MVVVFFAGAATFLIAKRFGSPIVNWIGYLPVLRQVVFDKYDEPSLGFCVAALGAVGLDELAGRRISPKAWSATIVATTVVLAVSFAQIFSVAGRDPSGYLVTSYAFGIAIVLATIVLSSVFVFETPVIGTLSAQLVARARYALVGSSRSSLRGHTIFRCFS